MGGDGGREMEAATQGPLKMDGMGPGEERRRNCFDRPSEASAGFNAMYLRV